MPTTSPEAAQSLPSTATDVAPLADQPEVAQIHDDLQTPDGPAPVVAWPDAAGHFEQFGGKFVPEALYAALQQLEEAFNSCITDPAFKNELAALLADYTGRPSPITEAKRFSAAAQEASSAGPRRSRRSPASCPCAW